MKLKKRILITLLMAELLTVAPFVSANPDQYENESYGTIVGRKLTSSLANVTTAFLEVPKNIIIDNNTSNSNFLYGFVGGTMEGMLNFLGRVSVGALDLVTAPIPTKPVAYPVYIWDDFDTKTHYGPVFRLENQ